MQLVNLTPHPMIAIALAQVLPSAAIICGLATLNCDGGSGTGLSGGAPTGGSDTSAPPDGEWTGDYIDFQLENGKLVDIQLKGVQCRKTDPAWPALELCKEEAPTDAVAGPLPLITNDGGGGAAPEWRFQAEAGAMVKISAIFSSSGTFGSIYDVVHGILDYSPGNTCDCQSRYNFEARFVPGPGWRGPDGQTVDPPDPDANTPPAGGGSAPADSNASQLAALTRINEYRHAVGLAAVDMHAALNSMATNHCACYAANVDKYKTTGMSAHDEDPEWGPPCYGSLGQRANAAGYPNAAAEVMAFYNDAAQAVDGWMATLYHRLPLISPQTAEVGYGGAPGCDTVNTGSKSGADKSAEVVYPYDGQIAADTCWDGYEIPQPPPPPGGYPSGPIITLEFGPGVNYTIEEASLMEADNTPVAHRLLVPSQGNHTVGQVDPYLPREAVSLYAHSPLKPLTDYTVDLRGKKNGQPWSKTWTFKTNPVKSGCW